eukprot:Nk52_evm64s2367 gene=Nk52_evmTU64s2367
MLFKNNIYFMLLGLVGASVIQTVAAEEAEDCGAEDLGDYSESAHIIGLFVVFAVSSLGIFTVLFLGEKGTSPIFAKVFQVTKCFGIGVIICTAWIHLLPDAFEQFSSDCLKGGWTRYGTNYVGLFALIAAFLIHAIEYYSITRGSSEEVVCEDCADEVGKAHSAYATNQDKEKAISESGSEATEKRDHVSILIVEFGLLVHSVIIGLDLGISDNDTFWTLLIAICFHQLFEGMAIGSLLTCTDMKRSTKVLMSLFYPLTTPAGVAIGIVVRKSYNENAQGMILCQGILNSLAAGLLMYSGYCQLIGGEINKSNKFATFSRTMKAMCFFAMYCGAGAMALLGLWA